MPHCALYPAPRIAVRQRRGARRGHCLLPEAIRGLRGGQAADAEDVAASLPSAGGPSTPPRCAGLCREVCLGAPHSGSGVHSRVQRGRESAGLWQRVYALRATPRAKCPEMHRWCLPLDDPESPGPCALISGGGVFSLQQPSPPQRPVGHCHQLLHNTPSEGVVWYA